MVYRYLQCLLDELDEGGGVSENCDKGPLLEQIKAHVANLDAGQTKLTDAMVDLARQQERIIALADKSNDHSRNIENLYTLCRDNDRQLTRHINSDHTRTSPPNTPDDIKSRAEMFDKVRVAVIIAFVIAVANALWDIGQRTLTILNNTGG